jgi:hypothetical protein
MNSPRWGGNKVWFCPYIILRGNGPVKVCIEPRQLHQNIFPDARNFAEKEKGSNAGRNTKIGRSSTAMRMLEKTPCFEILRSILSSSIEGINLVQWEKGEKYLLSIGLDQVQSIRNQNPTSWYNS